jgi:hypothetical protein
MMLTMNRATGRTGFSSSHAHILPLLEDAVIASKNTQKYQLLFSLKKIA